MESKYLLLVSEHDAVCQRWKLHNILPDVDIIDVYTNSSDIPEGVAFSAFPTLYRKNSQNQYIDPIRIPIDFENAISYWNACDISSFVGRQYETVCESVKRVIECIGLQNEEKAAALIPTYFSDSKRLADFPETVPLKFRREATDELLWSYAIVYGKELNISKSQLEKYGKIIHPNWIEPSINELFGYDYWNAQ